MVCRDASSDTLESRHAPSARAMSHPAGDAALSLKLPLWLLTSCVIGTLAYFCKGALAPIFYAILLALMLSPAVEFLVRRGLARTFSSLLTVSSLLIIFILAVDLAWEPAQRWIDSAPEVFQKAESKLTPARKIIARIDALTLQATSLTETTPAGQQSADTPGTRFNTLTLTRTALLNIATVTILTVLLLSSGVNMLKRIEVAVTNDGSTAHCINILVSIRSELSRYFSVITLINLGLGAVTTLILFLWGMPSPWLWGAMAALLNYIPYFGPATVLGIISIVALVSFPGFGIAVGVASCFLVLTTIEGQLIQPLWVGKRLNINPVVLFLSIWAAGWLWGIAGIMITTPVLITLKEITNRNAENSALKAALSG